MLSIQVLSIQINISWQKKERSIEKLERQIRVNDIDKKMDEMKAKCYNYLRYM